MKVFFPLIICVALTGCATGPAGTNAADRPGDPSQWRVVSITPVPVGTAARVAATSADGKAVEYSSKPAPLYQPAPVYTPPPLYGPIPFYPEAGYYWPPVSIGLGFVFGRHWGRGRGHRHRHH